MSNGNHQNNSQSPGGAFFIREGLFLVMLGLLFVVPSSSSLAQDTRSGYPAVRSGAAHRGGGREARPRGRRSADREREKGKGKEKAAGKADETAEEGLFLPEAAENQGYLPEIFRCPECGYEQDEAGTCPDHGDLPLIRVLTKDRNPLEPTELDGNEDLLVDIPITGLVLRKPAAGVASSPVSTQVPTQEPPQE